MCTRTSTPRDPRTPTPRRTTGTLVNESQETMRVMGGAGEGTSSSTRHIKSEQERGRACAWHTKYARRDASLVRVILQVRIGKTSASAKTGISETETWTASRAMVFDDPPDRHSKGADHRVQGAIRSAATHAPRPESHCGDGEHTQHHRIFGGGKL